MSKYVQKYEMTLKRLYSKLKVVGKITNRRVDITFEEFTVLRKSPCFYCRGVLPPTGMGLDRKNNLKEYTLDNVRPCCTICNSTKGKYLTEDEMLMLINYRRYRSLNLTKP